MTHYFGQLRNQTNVGAMLSCFCTPLCLGPLEMVVLDKEN